MSGAAERYRLTISWILGIIFVGLVLFSENGCERSFLYKILGLTGHAIVAISVLGRVWATIYIGGRKDGELLMDGPYSMVRNPLYLFSFLGVAGLILVSGKLLLLLAILPFWLYNYYVVILSEEARLHTLFGDKFVEYCKRVNRITPTFRDYWSRDHFDVYPKICLRSMLHASYFMWLLIGLEFLAYLKVTTNLIPALVRLPF